MHNQEDDTRPNRIESDADLVTPDNYDMSLLPLEGREAGKCLKFPSACLIPSKADEMLDWSLTWYSSPKLDGNRCLIINGVPFTSSMRPFRNVRLKDEMAILLEWSAREKTVVDLEIYDDLGTHHAALSGSLNSYCDELPPSTKFYLFDACSTDAFYDQCQGAAFEYRMERTIAIPALLGDPDENKYVVLPQMSVTCGQDIATHFEMNIRDGYEGSIVRAGKIKTDVRGNLVGGFYKHGRSTPKQQIGYKIKAFETTDGIITEVIQRRVLDQEKMEALGLERTQNPDGSLARINHKEAYSLVDMVGAFKVKYLVSVEDRTGSHLVEHWEETEISFANGFDHGMRKRLWECRNDLVGRWVEFSHMTHGSLDKARHGRLVRFRTDLDTI